MNWDFPDPREDPWYRRAYDGKYGKGAFERDLGLRKQDEQRKDVEASTPSDFFEVKSPFKQRRSPREKVMSESSGWTSRRIFSGTRHPL